MMAHGVSVLEVVLNVQIVSEFLIFSLLSIMHERDEMKGFLGAWLEDFEFQVAVD